MTGGIDPPILKSEREEIEKEGPVALFQRMLEMGSLTNHDPSQLMFLLKNAELHTLASQVKVRFEIGFHRRVTRQELLEAVDEEEKRNRCIL